MEGSEFSISNESLLEHAAWVRKLARELVRDPGAADDLEQETWLAFLRARPDTGRPLRPWLGRVARNAAALGARRRSGRAAREQVVARAEGVPSSHELVERAEQQRLLVASVIALDEPYRTTLLLRYYEGLTPAQIAKVQALPGATVRTHLQRGLAQLRLRLDKEHAGDRRAWVLMLQPWLGQPGPAIGAGVLALLATAALAILAAVLGFVLRTEQAEVAPLEVVRAADESRETDLLTNGARAPLPGPEPEQELAAELGAALVRELQLCDLTGRALAAYSVRVDGRVLTSDARGLLVLPASASSLLPTDDSRLALDVLASHERRERRAVQRSPLSLADFDPGDALVLPSGPEYSLEISPALSLENEQLEARLTASAHADSSLPWQVAPVRIGGNGSKNTWVRFSEVPSGAQATDALWQLEVRDPEGFCLGTAPIDNVQLAPPSRVHITLADTGVVAGHIGGLPAEGGVDVMIALRTKGEERQVVSWARAGKGGAFSLRWVPAGEYQLHVNSAKHAAWTADILVLARERVVRNLTLEPIQQLAGLVRGSVTSQSGSYDGQLLIFLLDKDNRTAGIFPTNWRRDEEDKLVADFSFEETPPGELHLDIVSLADSVTFRMQRESFTAPFDEVRGTLLDLLPASDWSVEVLDESTGIALPKFVVDARIDGGALRQFRCELGPREGESEAAVRHWTLVAGNLRWNKFQGPAPLRHLSTQVQLAWAIRAEGYEEARGEAAAFNVQSDGKRSLSVRMRRK